MTLKCEVAVDMKADIFQFISHVKVTQPPTLTLSISITCGDVTSVTNIVTMNFSYIK